MKKHALSVFSILVGSILLLASLSIGTAQAQNNEDFPTDCIDFSTEGFRFMVTNFCKKDISDLWICRAGSAANDCDQAWSKVGELKKGHSARVKNVSQKPELLVFYRACYAPGKIIPEESGTGFSCG